jgi:hypothetical protein
MWNKNSVICNVEKAKTAVRVSETPDRPYYDSLDHKVTRLRNRNIFCFHSGNTCDATFVNCWICEWTRAFYEAIFPSVRNHLPLQFQNDFSIRLKVNRNELMSFHPAADSIWAPRPSPLEDILIPLSPHLCQPNPLLLLNVSHQYLWTLSRKGNERLGRHNLS